MKARSLKAAVAFYLESRRGLGFALKSEGELLVNDNYSFYGQMSIMLSGVSAVVRPESVEKCGALG